MLWVSVQGSDGEIVGDDAPVLRGDDHGVVVGDGVFETAKVVGGQVFARSRHLRRLRRSADGLGLRYDEDAVQRGIDAVIEGAHSARLRITVTGGPSPYGSARGGEPASILIATSSLASWPETCAVVTVPWTRNENAATAGMKTTSYADNVIALDRAHDHDADEALFANTRGELCEGTGSNVFLGIAGTLVTPPTSSGCLAGITRELLLEWMPGIEQRPIEMTELARADEVFITSSTRDVQAVRSVDSRLLVDAPGPLTKQAADLFAQRSSETVDP